MASLITFSDVLGYTSIGCWLGAQFPQVLENIRQRSVEGLALPFLANWLLGDISNLVGCILTHQLPFQTYLAIYFCFVDLTLLGQYIYYRSVVKAPSGYRPIRSRTASTARRLSIERAPARYRTLSNVAANVAAVAALAAQQEEHARWHKGSVERHHPHNSTARDEVELGDEEEVSEEALARLADSFHSEGGQSGRRKVNWSSERRGGSLGPSGRSALSPTGRVHPNLHMTSPRLGGTEDFDFSSRGRPLVRASEDVAEGEEWQPTSAQRRSSRASRKGASMVFLSVWALFGVGTFVGSGRGVPSTSILHPGRVLVKEDVSIPFSTNTIPPVQFDQPPIAVVTDSKDPVLLIPTRRTEESKSQHPPGDDGPSTEYIIGRISAWTCTTLYLTSRLPQIWKNFVRKSVEGLSMYLFVFAFLGNFFYVASILTSPKLDLPPHEASAFIRESIPYLLGSGGTLMFDVTIVTQSFIYRPKHHNTRGRRASRTLNEEEAGLLSAGATGAEDPITPSRRRVQGDSGHD
ncbi:Lysosomal/Vacuolar Amino Acid Transporter 1 [Abortiporus biennis]